MDILQQIERFRENSRQKLADIEDEISELLRIKRLEIDRLELLDTLHTEYSKDEPIASPQPSGTDSEVRTPSV